MIRISKLRNLNICDAYIIISQINRSYLTGYKTSFGYLLVTAESAFYITDFRYSEEASDTFKDTEVDVVGVAGAQAKDRLVQLLQQSGAKTIGFEGNRITFSEYSQLSALLSSKGIPAEFIDVDEQLNNLRVLKEPGEIESIAKAQQIADKAFSKILNYIKPGLSEREICNELNHQMMMLGAEGVAFDTIVASGTNSSRPHSGVSIKKVSAGEFITLDFGAVINDYRSDMTRTIAVGKVTEEMQQIYNAVLKAQQVSIAAYKEHVSCKEAYTIAYKCLQSYGYADFFVHGLGHGVGLEIHEGPSINANSDVQLCAGMVVTAEPGVYMQNKFGVRIEDLIVITESGMRNLTSSDKQLITL